MLTQVLAHPWWIPVGAIAVLIAVRLGRAFVTAAVALVALVWVLDLPGFRALLP